MADIDPNFTCSNPELSRTNVTAEVWMINSEGNLHENSIIAVAICQTLIIAIGIPWNIIVLTTIIIKQLYKEITYILLINLVVSDLLVCLCVLPFNIASAYAQGFNIGNSDHARCQVCHTIVIVIVALVFVSLFTLALMSLDRLIYIKWPLLYKDKITAGKLIIVLCIVWIFCILISIPPVFGLGEIKFANILSSCSLLVVGETPLTANVNYVILLAFIGFFPFMTTVIANIWLLTIVCKNVRGRHKKSVNVNSSRFDSETLRRNSESQLKTDFHKRQIRLAQVFGALFTANVVTWVPSILIAVIGAAIGVENIPPPAFALVYLAYVSQPAIHPVLETCLVGKARVMLFKCIFFCRRKSKRSFNSGSGPLQLQTKKSSVSSISNITIPLQIK